jgi:hypothetical protein
MTYKEALENIKRNTNILVENNKTSANSMAKNAIDAIAKNAGITVGERSNSKKCNSLPGTVLRIFVPSGTVVNILNLVEVKSPSGISLIVRLPFLGGLTAPGFKNPFISAAMDAIRAAGGSIEILS